LTGCLFHLSQCIYRRVQSEGLQNLYASDEEISLQVRMLSALSFLPLDAVISTFEEFAESARPEIQTILDYFEDSFIERPSRHSRRPLVFHLNIWNQYTRAQEELPRTNNHAEGSSGGHRWPPSKFLTFLVCSTTTKEPFGASANAAGGRTRRSTHKKTLQE